MPSFDRPLTRKQEVILTHIICGILAVLYFIKYNRPELLNPFIHFGIVLIFPFYMLFVVIFYGRSVLVFILTILIFIDNKFIPKQKKKLPYDPKQMSQYKAYLNQQKNNSNTKEAIKKSKPYQLKHKDLIDVLDNNIGSDNIAAFNIRYQVIREIDKTNKEHYYFLIENGSTSCIYDQYPPSTLSIKFYDITNELNIHPVFFKENFKPNSSDLFEKEGGKYIISAKKSVTQQFIDAGNYQLTQGACQFKIPINQIDFKKGGQKKLKVIAKLEGPEGIAKDDLIINFKTPLLDE
jgi:hypothetical protein